MRQTVSRGAHNGSLQKQMLISMQPAGTNNPNSVLSTQQDVDDDMSEHPRQDKKNDLRYQKDEKARMAQSLSTPFQRRQNY